MAEDIPEKFRQDLEIVRETAAQVLKDFVIFSLEIQFSGNEFTAYEELKAQIIPVLNKLLQEDRIRFQSLLYRIDISEKNFRRAVLSIGSGQLSELITDMILQREFQKVLTRKYFSGKKDK